jgi:hypothetical protein
MIKKAYTLLADVNITYHIDNPWGKRREIEKIIQLAVTNALTDAKLVEVSISEMDHKPLSVPDLKQSEVKQHE